MDGPEGPPPPPQKPQPGSSGDEEEEFYDADEYLSPRSRGNSLKRDVLSPSGFKTAQQSLVDTLSSSQSGSIDQDQVLNYLHKQSAILPQEIERELKEISQEDLEKRRRIHRLRRLQRGENLRIHDEELEGNDGSESKVSTDEAIGDSREPSAEGLFVSRHPFKVIESDSRSTTSESKSVQSCSSRSNLRERRQSQDSFPGQQPGHELDINHPGTSYFVVQESRNPVPDIVSSIQSEKVGALTQSKGATSPCHGQDSRSSSRLTRSKTPDTLTANSSSAAGAVAVVVMENEQLSLHTKDEFPPRPPRRKKRDSTPQFAFPPNINPAAYIHSPTSPHLFPTSLIHSSTPISESGHTGLKFDSPDVPCTEVPNPASTVASLTRDLESTLMLNQESLDLRSATRGQYVVKPQDDETCRGDDFLSQDDVFGISPNESQRFFSHSVGGRIPFEEGKSQHSHNLLEHQQSLPTSSSDIGTPGTFGFQHSMGSRSQKNLGFESGSGGRRSSGSRGGHSSLGSKGGSGGRRSSSGLNSGGSMDSTGILGSGSSAMRQMNMYLRTKSESGKRLTDEDILKQIKVKNLDTGEEMDLVEAEDKLPSSINPLSLHIMRLTSEYVSSDKSTKALTDSDTESMISSVSGHNKKRKSVVKRIFGDAVKSVRKTTDVAKHFAVEATKKKPTKDPLPPSIPETSKKEMEKLGRLSTDIKAAGSSGFKRIQAHKSGPFDFENIQFAQELPSQHLGPIWCMRFSQCGQLLATAGQDTSIRIWVVRDAYNTFREMRSRYNSDSLQKSSTSPTNSYDNVIADQEAILSKDEDKKTHVFNERPFCSYQGHTSEVLDLCWSKNYFLLSSSMDKTVRLWHISRRECLCCFQHIDFVTALAFHPRNDQFFLSASLDGKLRLWNIPDKKVTLWNEIEGQSKLITAANFIQNGKFAVVGTYDGRCIFYSTDQLKYYTMIHVRSTRGKNSQGRKVTGIEPMPGEDKILVTSNDSRIRIYDLRDLSLTCKYKGYTNSSSQIRASFSHDGKYITSGSENQCVFLWRTQYESTNLTARKDRNSFYEAIKAHSAVVTCSVFATNPDYILNQIRKNCDLEDKDKEEQSQGQTGTLKGHKIARSQDSNLGYVVVSGDFDGDIKVFYLFSKPKHSSLPPTLLSN